MGANTLSLQQGVKGYSLSILMIKVNVMDVVLVCIFHNKRKVGKNLDMLIGLTPDTPNESGPIGTRLQVIVLVQLEDTKNFDELKTPLAHGNTQHKMWLD